MVDISCLSISVDFSDVEIITSIVKCAIKVDIFNITFIVLCDNIITTSNKSKITHVRQIIVFFKYRDREVLAFHV